MLFDDEPITFVVKPTYYEEDPLAILLACYPYHKKSYEPMEQISSFMVNINDKDNRVKITAEHRKNAHKIAKYYKNKIFTRMITNQHCSNYRKELYNVLVKDNRNALVGDEIRLLYWLPYFYQEDLWYDELEKTHPLKKGKFDEVQYNKCELTFVKSVIRSSKKIKSKSYWFKDKLDIMNTIVVNLDNPLISLFENELSRRNNTIHVSGTATQYKIVERNIGAYILSDWTLEDV